MPVNIPDNLPAVNFLRNENISVITHSSLKNNENTDSIKLLILNLMPKKIDTENQFLRLLSYSHLQIDIYLLRIDKRTSKNTSNEHLNTFYLNFEDIYKKNFDALLVTGAPLGLIDFKNVLYWSKMKKILKWAKEHVISILFVCWSAQAALKIFYNIPKYTRKIKISGIYKHKILNQYSLLTRGFDDIFFVPHSRYADFSNKILSDYTDLELFAHSDEIGAYLFANADKSLVFVTGHPEYDSCTIGNEYQRDVKLGLNPALPINYFHKNNSYPDVTWRSHGNLLFSNWLYYYVYQKK